MERAMKKNNKLSNDAFVSRESTRKLLNKSGTIEENNNELESECDGDEFGESTLRPIMIIRKGNADLRNTCKAALQ